MADQTPRRRAVAAWGETRRVARPWRPTLVWATATDEPQGSCRRGTTPAAGTNLLGLSKVRALSPRAALLVIASAILWLPLSAAISIAMHAVLLAKAASLPAWMQLLHPVATIIAKSKILVLPVYPAAWPQAKKHAWVQAAFHCMHCIAALNCIRKAAHRYQQAETGFAQAGDGLRRAASRIGTASPT
jgi:hypothetical protein